VESWRIWIDTAPVEKSEWERLVENLQDELSLQRKILGPVARASGLALGSVFEVGAPTARKALEIGLAAFERALEAIGVGDLAIRQLEIEPGWFEGDDVLGAVDGARLLGISRQRFYQLQEQPGFPAPAAELARGALWP
jgi:hypothetical protein